MRGVPCSRVVGNERRSCPHSMLRLYEAPCGRQAGLETTGRDDLTAMGREKLAFLDRLDKRNGQRLQQLLRIPMPQRTLKHPRELNAALVAQAGSFGLVKA
ncbi:hypothetical protein MTO96_016852 [Rhipicephalus appendiculatus]